VTLNSGLEVTQDHWKWYHSKAWVRFPVRNQLYAITTQYMEITATHTDRHHTTA